MVLPRFAACAALVVCAFSLLDSSAARAESALPLAPHRAVYDLTLAKGGGSKAPAQARGRIAFDFSGTACDGWVQNFRQVTELQPEESAAQVSDMRSTTFEAGDGADYRFKITTKINDAAAEESDGVAKKGKTENFSVELSKPKRSKLDLKGPILFPTEHMRHIIDAARAQQTILEARVYDGSGDGSKIFETMTVIGKPITAAATEKPFQVETFKNMRRWPVAISYFEVEKRDEQPAYILSLDLYENGVTHTLKLDYGDFILAAEATSLTLLPAGKCDK